MDVGRRALSALKWTAGAKLVGQLLTWAITLVVIRLLSPSDYGLVAMTMVFVGLVGFVADLGLGVSVVQARELEPGQLRRVFGAIIVTNLLGGALVFASAPLIARFFGEPKLTLLVQVVSLEFAFAAVGSLPSALLRRELKFRALSLIDLATTLIGSLVTLALAFRGAGPWALVLGTLAKAGVRALALNLFVPPRLAPQFGFAGLGRLFAFGGLSTLNGILWHLFSQIDALIIGKLLGKEVLGIYSVAMQLAMLPLTKVLGVIQPVALPAFARLQDDLPRVARTVIRSIRVMMVAAFPVFWGISCVAPEIVEVLLGSKWKQAELLLQLLPLVMPLRLIAGVISSAVNGIGRVDVLVRNTATALGIMTAGFIVGCRWGVLGVSLTWVLLYPLVMAFNFRRSLQVLSLQLLDVLKALAWPLAASAVMYGSVMAARMALEEQVPGIALLLLLIAVGAVTYGCVTLLFNRDALDQMMRLTRT